MRKTKEIVCRVCGKKKLECIRHRKLSSIIRCDDCDCMWVTKAKRRHEIGTVQVPLPFEPLWTPTTIRLLLSTNNKAVIRGMVVLHERQTFDEQLCEATFVSNGKGFDAHDAGICSRIAMKIKTNSYITKKELTIARRKTQKYAKQLAEVANAKMK